MRPATTAADPAAEERCLCGNLVAKITPAGVEILCRRCKRMHRLPWQHVAPPTRARDGPDTQRSDARGQRS